MRIRKHNKARVVNVAYASTIAFTPGSADVTLRVAELTGALALTITDSFAEDGDVLKLLFHADGSQRIVTLDGAGVLAGTITVALNTSKNIFMMYNSVDGKYSPAVALD